MKQGWYRQRVVIPASLADRGDRHLLDGRSLVRLTPVARLRAGQLSDLATGSTSLPDGTNFCRRWP